MESYSIPPANPEVDSLKQKIQLFISCRNLKDLDIISKSDPFVEVWLKNDERSSWVKVAQTETINNNLNPDFSTPIPIDYYFEKIQEIRFEVYDQDPSRREEQGKHQTKVSALLGAKNQTYYAELKLASKPKSKRGQIIVTTDCVKSSNKSVKMSLSWNGLKSKKEFFGLISTNHPFLVIRRYKTQESAAEDYSNTVKVFTSNILHGTLMPSWNLGELKLETLCNNNIDIPLIFEIWSFQKSGKHRIYGRVIGSVREMLDSVGQSQHIIK